MLDLDDLQFIVADDGKTSLVVGAVSVEVCSDPFDFPDFVTALVRKLNEISFEMGESA